MRIIRGFGFSFRVRGSCSNCHHRLEGGCDFVFSAWGVDALVRSGPIAGWFVCDVINVTIEP